MTAMSWVNTRGLDAELVLEMVRILQASGYFNRFLRSADANALVLETAAAFQNKHADTDWNVKTFQQEIEDYVRRNMLWVGDDALNPHTTKQRKAIHDGKD